MAAETVNDALDRARDAYRALGEVGEAIDDEWSYVTELGDAWSDRLDAAAARHRSEPLTAEVDAAIDRAIDEITGIDDPHRAIDWLSTFPQVVLLAIGEWP